jgi:hypothetical protein
LGDAATPPLKALRAEPIFVVSGKARCRYRKEEVMEYDEPTEVIAADAANFERLMLRLALTDPATMSLIASQLSRSFKAGRNTGRSEGFRNGFACGVPL